MPNYAIGLRNPRTLSTPGIIVGAVLLAAAATPLRAAEHTLMPSPQTVHIGHFDASIKPVLTIDSGDTVDLVASDHLDPAVTDQSGVVPPSAVPEFTRAINREVKDRGPSPHFLTGPIFVNGAMPGDVLEVRILDVQLAIPYGYNQFRPGAGGLPNEFAMPFRRVIPLDMQARTATLARGVVVPLDRPFFGTMGVAPPPSAGRISSGPPGMHAGNLDNKDLGAGSILYLPVNVPGALFSAGDAHAAQGHGEVDGGAIETGLRGRFQFIVHKDMKLVWPRGETATHWMVMGLHRELEEATRMAIRETLDFITGRFPHVTREEAYMIATVAVDYHITQVVDGVKGVHGMIPKAIFKTP